MFWGWGRILGSLLGGPLGTLGRPPGACKAKAVTRVCFNTVEACDDDAKNVVCESHQVATLQETTADKDVVEKFRLGSMIFHAGHEFIQRSWISNLPDQHEHLRNFLTSLSRKNEESAAEKQDETRLRPTLNEFPILLKLLFSFSKSSLVQVLTLLKLFFVATYYSKTSFLVQIKFITED